MKNYVKKYKGYDVPEGATHYLPDTEKYCEGWYMVNEASGRIKFRHINGALWHSTHYCIPNSAIELPEEPKAEWMPEVGVECEMMAGPFEWRKCIPLYVGSVFVVYTANSSEGSLSKNFFRPLKTKEEKDRESFHLKAFEVHKHDMSCNEFATALYKAGFTAPKEGE